MEIGKISVSELTCLRANLVRKNYVGLKGIIEILKDCGANTETMKTFQDKYKVAKSDYKSLFSEIKGMVLQEFSEFKSMRLNFTNKEIVVYG